MPRLCANLKWLFTERPFLERFSAAANAGFTAVEYASPYEHSVPRLRELLKAYGLTQVLINTPTGDPASGAGSGLACLPGRQQEFRDSVKKALDYAVGLECGLVHVMAGIQLAGTSRDAAFAVYLTNIAWAAELAGQANVRLSLEAVNQHDAPGFFLQTQEQGAAVIAAIGSPYLGLQFDVYHCQISQGDVTRRMEAVMPLIAHMQIADAPLRNEPGTGEIAWDYVFRRIDELGYQGWVGCEYRPASDTESGLKWRNRYAV
ncbi:hydroxypyruvate isomerase family protein [Caballeronia sp. 15715]|uniref:hydroxypyruvate isomerase family protein n=1 Tax=unclassified Caballeronia TaxID=2646786 RepID=UPI0039E47E55